MKISICDDDIMQTNLLKSYVEEFFSAFKTSPKISIFHNGEEFINCSQDIDLLFLDIEMPGINGIDVGNLITKSNPKTKIIVITSYMEYLDDAMRFNVFRYINKPIDKNRLYKNLKDFLLFYNEHSRIIPIETKSGVTCVNVYDIIQVVADEKKVYVHTIKEILKSTRTMDYFEEQLTEKCFFRTHRSYIVNFDYVESYSHSYIKLRNIENEAFLTQRKYSKFKRAHLFYIENNT